MLVYTPVLFIYTFHGGAMKLSVNLAVLAVVIFFCAHGGAAGKHRGKCVRKERTRATQDICDDHKSMLIADSGPCSKGRRKVLSFSFITETKRSP